MSRRQGRDLALKALYQYDLVGTKPRQALDYLAEEEETPQEARSFAGELIEGTLAHRAEIDAKITAYARDWRIERLAPLDRNILRLAIFQIMFRSDIPASVAINEAVELAKTYGEAESSRFINGILGQLARDLAQLGDGGGQATERPAD